MTLNIIAAFNKILCGILNTLHKFTTTSNNLLCKNSLFWNLNFCGESNFCLTVMKILWGSFGSFFKKKIENAFSLFVNGKL